MTTSPMWQPPNESLAYTQLSQFQTFINQKYAQELKDYSQLHEFSINNRAKFWRAVIDFCGVIYHQEASHDLIDEGHMIQARWFEGMTLNFAENLLRHQGPDSAIIFEHESGEHCSYSFDQFKTTGITSSTKIKTNGHSKRGSYRWFFA